jgi:CheY-like chemotaxis protein
MVSPTARDCHVLIAEDDDDLREWLQQTLEHEGYQVLEARDGAELLVNLATLEQRGELPLLMVSDLAMPNCDGLEAAAEARAKVPALPILLITAFDARDVRESARDVVDAVLQKPFSREALLLQIEKLGFASPARRS